MTSTTSTPAVALVTETSPADLFSAAIRKFARSAPDIDGTAIESVDLNDAIEDLQRSYRASFRSVLDALGCSASVWIDFHAQGKDAGRLSYSTLIQRSYTDDNGKTYACSVSLLKTFVDNPAAMAREVILRSVQIARLHSDVATDDDGNAIEPSGHACRYWGKKWAQPAYAALGLEGRAVEAKSDLQGRGGWYPSLTVAAAKPFVPTTKLHGCRPLDADGAELTCAAIVKGVKTVKAARKAAREDKEARGQVSISGACLCSVDDDGNGHTPQTPSMTIAQFRAGGLGCFRCQSTFIIGQDEDGKTVVRAVLLANLNSAKAS